MSHQDFKISIFKIKLYFHIPNLFLFLNSLRDSLSSIHQPKQETWQVSCFPIRHNLSHLIVKQVLRVVSEFSPSLSVLSSPNSIFHHFFSKSLATLICQSSPGVLLFCFPFHSLRSEFHVHITPLLKIYLIIHSINRYVFSIHYTLGPALESRASCDHALSLMLYIDNFQYIYIHNHMYVYISVFVHRYIYLCL